MKTTKFTLFKNTPFNDFQNTIHFKDNDFRDGYFDGRYDKIEFEQKFNFVRDRLELNISYDYSQLDGLNYCRFISERDNKTYYAFIPKMEYVSTNVTKIYLIIDVIMTFTQGYVLQSLTNVEVIRQHLPNEIYNNYLPQLRTNMDILKTSTKRYVFQSEWILDNLQVIFQSSSDLESDFGNVDNPKLKTSSGITFDNVTSPLNLYQCSFNDFNTVMSFLSDYPWISQNIKKVIIVPIQFLDNSKLESVSPHYDELKLLKKFTDGAKTRNYKIEWNHPIKDLYSRLGLDPIQDKHLFRSEYGTIEVYSWDGQQLILDPAFIDDTFGLQFKLIQINGYNSQVAIYPTNYKTSDSEEEIKYTNEESGEETISENAKGTFLNNAIIFSNFDEIPILIDNYKLSMANNANRRQLAENKLLSNRVANVFDSKANLSDRFFNAVNLISNISPTNLFGKFNDEYEFYRTQKAEFADLALSTPTITNQTTGNSFLIANNIWGLVLKMSAPTPLEMNKVRKYYSMFGFELNENASTVYDLESMTVCNYLQIKGNYTLPYVDVALIEQLKAQLENGVRFWHVNDYNLQNPMQTNPLLNERRV